MTIRKEKYAYFREKIMSPSIKNRRPIVATFELTRRCNFHCLHCYIIPDKNKKELSTRDAMRILDQLRDAGCLHISFTGGELLLRKDIFKILDHAKRSGFIMSLITNGYFIDQKAADRIASLGNSLGRVNISVLGATGKTCEKITGRKTSFEHAIRAIKLLKDRGVNVQMLSVLLQENKAEFLAIRKLADKLGVQFKSPYVIRPKGTGDRSPMSHQVPPGEIDEIDKALPPLSKAGNECLYRKKFSAYSVKNSLFNCRAGTSAIFISPYGEMNVCLDICEPRYNILRGSIEEGWKLVKDLVRSQRPTKGYRCRRCVLRPFCGWCPGESWLYAKNFVQCVRVHRENALASAKRSPAWEKIAPLWERQKIQFYGE